MEGAGAGPSSAAAGVQRAAEQLIENHFLEAKPTNWVPVPIYETHESKTITCEVPLGKTFIS
jgi:hypothetical protein